MTNEDNIKRIEELVAKYDAMKKRDKMDLSSDQDLTLAVMNLISIEEHLFFTGVKTGNDEYFDVIKEVRDMRKELLQEIIKEYEGEVWCISKHLLAASYRLMEVGTKQLNLGNKKEAHNFFAKAYSLYSLFWGIQMQAVSIKDIKKIDEDILNKKDTKSGGVFASLGELVKKVVNCCIE